MRTTEQIVKEFEMLGYEKPERTHKLWYGLVNKEKNITLEIDYLSKAYIKYDKDNNGVPIELKEHELLNELFKKWEWFDFDKGEKRILDDFKELGYIIEKDDFHEVILWKPPSGETIGFDKRTGEYEKYKSVGDESCAFTKEEHSLIHELFINYCILPY